MFFRVVSSRYNQIFSASILGLLGISYHKFPIQMNSKEPEQINTHQFVYQQKASEQPEFTYRLKSRDQHIQEIQQQEYDVIIIGGGATGSGVALECAQRGLKSVVVEANDFAQGASSKSTKLVHGGVRYLQQVFEISLANGRWEKLKLVIEALRERSTFLTICQNFTKEIPILVPCDSIFYAGYYYSGSLLYHLIYKLFSDTNTFQFKAPKIVGSDEIKLYFPNSKCPWGVLYSDGQFNDSRMVMELLLTSTIENYHKYQNKHSNILNYAEVQNLIKNEYGQIKGVQILDKITKEKINIIGKTVINATGCFADQIRQMDDKDAKNRIISSGGSHLILPQQFGSKKWGYLIPKTVDGRVLFILPWMNNILVGTTEKQYAEPVINPIVSMEEQIWLTQQFHSQFQNISLLDITKNIKSKWSGLRPLVHPGFNKYEKIDTKQIARNHVVEVSQSGLISIMGGKWTIYRKMGEDTVDEIFNQFQKQGVLIKQQPSISKNIKLLGEFEKSGQCIQDRKQYLNKYIQIVQKQQNLSKQDSKYFVKMYGDRCFDIFKIYQENPSYNNKIHPQLPHTIGEIIYLIRYEMAATPQDILYRRISLGFLDQNMMWAIHSKVFEIFAKEKQWDDDRQIYELQQVREHLKNLQ